MFLYSSISRRNVKEQTKALEAWQSFIDISNETLIEIISFLNEEDYSTKDFLNLTSLNPKETIIRLYEISGNASSGMSIEKLIELNLINNAYTKEVEANLHLFKSAQVKALKLFNYDLANIRDKQGLFSFNSKFKKAMQEHFTICTNS